MSEINCLVDHQGGPCRCFVTYPTPHHPEAEQRQPDKHDEIAESVIAPFSLNQVARLQLPERIAAALRSQAAEYEAELKEKDAKIKTVKGFLARAGKSLNDFNELNLDVITANGKLKADLAKYRAAMVKVLGEVKSTCDWSPGPPCNDCEGCDMKKQISSLQPKLKGGE